MAKNYRLMRINKDGLSVRVQRVAEYHGFKTVGKFEDLLNQMKPTAKLSLPTGHVRVNYLLRDIQAFKHNVGEQQ